jgi:hypothetical protein
MSAEPVFFERVTSKRTEALFVVLTLAFLLLFGWRTLDKGLDSLGILFLFIFAFFLFYSVNYSALIIRLSEEDLSLRFGLFTWTIPVRNIEACYPDQTSLWRIGGAGIHFTFLAGRYRAMFNFLEHPRLVIALAQRRGPVRDIAFSTSRLEELRSLIEARMVK